MGIREYDGPLDLLLDEVRRQNVAIEDIAMAPIVGRFLEYVRSAAGRNLNLDMEWLHMAATLIQWKSRALLPGERQADPVREELVRQLQAHRRLAAEALGELQDVEDKRLPRAAEAATSLPPEPSFTTVWDLMQQARDLARWAERHGEDRRRWRESFGVEQDEVTVGGMMEHLRGRLAAGERDGVRLLEEQKTVARRSCLFLGMLEMARRGEMQIEQNEAFGEILLS